jgi:predicted RNA-binding protein with PIN domain
MSANLLFIVDGYNVLHAFFDSIASDELADRREWLVERLTGFAALKGARVLVVFDVHGRCGVTTQRVGGTAVEVSFAGGPYAADALIARRIAEQPADVTVFVVSADQEVQRTASRAGVHRLTPRELAAELRDPTGTVALPEKSGTLRTQLEDEVDVETLRKLEQMRTKGREPDS